MSVRETVLKSAARRYQDSQVIPGAAIRSLNAAEFRSWKLRPFDTEGNTDAKKLNQQDAALIQLCLCEGEDLVFTDGELDQVACMDAGLAQKLMREIESHLGIGDEQEAFEDTVKNSEETPSVSLRTA